ncbi:hypothetical protein VdG1_06936 [Verticillium dahliae VDG1]|nr:hypothetical protein VdG1_06936 [Verticillium dahliae VDG1]
MTSLKRTLDRDPAASNLSSKVYVRSTKSGKVQKIVREVYLRQDIPCSSKLCRQCHLIAPRDASGKAQPFVLSDKPAGTKAFPQGHYIIPDTNALLNAMDLFEQSSAFYDVIVLQTRFYVFFNEFRLETYIHRETNETVNDRNDRAVRRSVKWYGEHLAEHGSATQPPAVVMLSDDQDCLRKAKADGLHGMSLAEYVGGLEEADTLLDMVPDLQNAGSFKKQEGPLYPEYYSMSKMMTGTKAGLLHQGIFNVSPYNYLEGSIKVPSFVKPLLILGRENISRAINGDLVVVEVLPKEQWKEPSTKIIEEETITRNENADDEGGSDLVSARERKALQEEVKKTQSHSTEGRPQPTAKVVGVIKRNWRQYVGHIDPSSTSQSGTQGRRQENVFLIPMDKCIPKIRIRTRQAAELLGKRLVVTIDAWERDSRHPVGHFVRSLGELETKQAETEALLLEHDVQYRPFPKTVLDCLPKEGHDWRVPTSLDDPGWRGREDLRSLLICSIDPIGCQDIDDALHARSLPNGNYEVGVHIADVSNFVKPLTAMDNEASIRGTSVYLVDKRIDMLPMLLGTDLCSLNPYIERFAFSVIWELDENADMVNVRFTKSVIKSREALSYEAAQLRVDDASQTDELTQGIRMLMKLSRKLKQKRMDAGALSLSSPEVKVQMESETSDPIDVKTKELLDTMSLVEEFMLFANVSVAAKIYEAFPQTAILRRHGAPPKTNFDELANQLKVKKGLELRVDSSKALADSLDTCVDPENPFFNTLALKGREAEEDAFVMKIFSNGFVVLVPRFGIEGLIRLRDIATPEPDSTFDADNYVLETTGSREVKVELFQKVRVRVQDDMDERTGKRGVKMELVTA